MDWVKQTQDMYKGWMDFQMKNWQSWLKSVQAFDKAEPAKLWGETIDAWQESVKGTLTTQVEGSRIWAENLVSMEGVPKEAADWAKQVQDMTKNWTDMQQKLWDEWFAVVKKADPSKFAAGLDDGGILKSWQDMAQKAMDTQTEAMRSLTTMGQPKKGK